MHDPNIADEMLIEETGNDAAPPSPSAQVLRPQPGCGEDFPEFVLIDVRKQRRPERAVRLCIFAPAVWRARDREPAGFDKTLEPVRVLAIGHAEISHEPLRRSRMLVPQGRPRPISGLPFPGCTPDGGARGRAAELRGQSLKAELRHRYHLLSNHNANTAGATHVDRS